MDALDSQSTQSGAAAGAPSTGPSPVVTIFLITVNVGIFVLMCITGVPFFSPTAEPLIRWGANYGPLTLGGQWWRMFTSLFLHFGIFHLAFNMIVLANIGPFMEALSGGAAYLVLYLVAGLGGGAASLWWHPATVSAGASGAIFGLYGALLAFLLRNRNSMSREVLAPLQKGAVLFVGYNLVYGLVRPDVDLSAHLGGLLAGFVLGLFLVQPVSQAAPDGRGGRIFAAAGLGIALVITTVVALPTPDDLQAEVKRMSAVEDKSLALYNTSLKQWKSDQLTGQQFADILEQQVLPKWRAERDSLAKLKRLSGKQKQLASLLVQYMSLREESWSLLADGVRTQDADKIKRSGEKGDQADKLVDKIGAS